ncbi:hypothetical protein BHE74_00043145, partial [Ensete ventricosum]
VRKANIVAEADMGTKTKKGIFKPLKYFSQIFGMQTHTLGSPCDWFLMMKEYHSAPLSSSCGEDGRESSPPDSWGSQDFTDTKKEFGITKLIAIQLFLLRLLLGICVADAEFSSSSPKHASVQTTRLDSWFG